MKIIITGIAGAIGSHLAERLLDEGHEVVGIDILTPYYSPDIKRINISDIEQKGGKVFLLDLVTDDFRHVLTDVDFVFHLAAQPGISASTSFGDYLKNNVVATEHLLQQVKNVPTLKGFIHASTSSVYGAHALGDETEETKPNSYYGVTKLAAEQLALSYHRSNKIPVSVIRFFSVYGERERPEKLYHKLIKSILEDREFPLYSNSREHVRSYTYVQDVVDGCILVMNNFDKAVGQIFNLGNNETMTTGEGIDIIEEIIGKKGNFIKLPPRMGDQLETSANIQKMKDTFGYKPKVSLKDGLKKEVEWYKEKLYKKPSKKTGLLIRLYALKEEDALNRIEILKKMVDKAKAMDLFSRIDVLIPIDKKYEVSDWGKTAKLLRKENLENIYIHEIEDDYIVGLLNYGIQLHYTSAINHSLVTSLESLEYFTKENIQNMIHAMQSGAKVSGIAIDVLYKSILEGRIVNTFALWDTGALIEVGGFDLSSRAKLKNEENSFYGTEEIQPIIRIAERYGPCVAPLISAGSARWLAPNKELEPENYERHQAQLKSKYLRQKYYAEALGKDFEFIKDSVVPQYRSQIEI